MDRDRRRIPERASRLSLPRPWQSTVNGSAEEPKISAVGSSSPEQLGYVLRSALRQYGFGALSLGLVAAGVAFAAFLLLIAPKYEAYALLRVVPTVPRLAFDTVDSGARDFYETYRQTQVSLVTSPEVLGAALDRPGVRDLPEVKAATDPVPWLADQLQVESLRDTELMRVSLVRSEGEAASRLVNAVVDSYMEQVVQGVDADRARRIALLEEQRQAWGEEFERKQKKLRELGEEVGTIDSGALGEKQRAILDRFVKVRQELTQVEIDRLAVEAQLRAYESPLQHGNFDVPQQTVDAGIRADERVRFYEQALANVNYDLTELRQRVRDPQDVSITQLELKRALLAKALEQRKDQLRPEIEALQRHLVVQGIQQKTAETEKKIAQLAEQEKVLRELVAEEQIAADRIGLASLDIKFLRDDLKRTEEVYDQLVATLDALRVESKAPGRVTVTAHADVPLAPFKQLRRYVVATTLGILGFSMVQFVIFGLAIANPRIGSAEELIVRGRVEVLGTLPKLSAKGARTGEREMPPALPSHREYEAAVDSLRAMLLLDRRKPQGGFAVSVTSAARREGKSIFAAHLAASAARVGKKVLLIDADLYHPSLDKLFGLPHENGLAQVVGQSLDVDTAITTTCIPRLDLLPAGLHASSPNVMLQDEAFGHLVNELNERYDLVVIDTPPVLGMPDALYVGRASDLCVLSVLCDESRQVLVEQARERLKEVGVQVRGVVLHGAPLGVFASTRRQPQNGKSLEKVPEKTNGMAASTGLN